MLKIAGWILIKYINKCTKIPKDDLFLKKKNTIILWNIIPALMKNILLDLQLC